jgi:succinylglutamate-semialdehyde dehydrogenase
MSQFTAKGNFIHGSFINEGSLSIESRNPSSNFAPVFSAKSDLSHVEMAIESARKAYLSWRYTTIAERRSFLNALKNAFKAKEESLAEAISIEMGKIYSESLVEAKSLSLRIDLMLHEGLKRVHTEELYELRAETRYHSQGVLAVIGPYNFPAHLLNAHVIPSLVMGNCVIIKPSEVCPLVGQLYAECFLEAGFPPGVVNLLQGDGRMGKALVAHPQIDGVLFTGSYASGRAIEELLLDQPHKILALELGGKNFALVMDDADIKQAALEIIQGAFLTTGQRCTATSRVLVHENCAEELTHGLKTLTKNLNHARQPKEKGFYGPLATKAAFEKFLLGLKRAKSEGAQVILESETFTGGAFVSPSIYQVDGQHSLSGYLSEELFGPNICIETFSSLDRAIERINESPYGLSNSIFTLNRQHAERLYHESKSGVLNINRSTNGAYGQMPFGGVNRSGNQRPAGIDAVRYASFPVAMSELAYGESSASPDLALAAKPLFSHKRRLSELTQRHQIEALFELFGINAEALNHDRLIFAKSSFDALGKLSNKFFNELVTVSSKALQVDENYLTFICSNISDQNFMERLKDILETYNQAVGLSLRKLKTLSIHVPKDLKIPRSRMMLDRLYYENFVPKEKKSLVADLHKSKGPYLVSVDDDPLILFDAASQIATIGAGFMADPFLDAYDRGEFDHALLRNIDLSLEDGSHSEAAQDAVKAQNDFEAMLHEKSAHVFSSIAYGAGGAEANEIAFDLCRQNGQRGTRVIAFEGAFHGRSLLALQATYNKEKRGPFSFSGYEATFLPFPENKFPDNEPSFSKDFLKSLAEGIIPKAPADDELLLQELSVYEALLSEVKKGNVACVIIEPMQCEGGDRYATKRFFNGLRALTRALKIPLVFDEVQCGFHLGRSFFWHQSFALMNAEGKPDYPDCVTLGKKAQLGVCMSLWPNPRKQSPHVVQLKRGLIHAHALSHEKALWLERFVKIELERLKDYFPELVLYPRVCGFAFAFDMPSNKEAMELINRRFEKGYMVYIAGEKTLRFRLNMASDDNNIRRLFEKIMSALSDLRDGVITKHQKAYFNNDKEAQSSDVIKWELLELSYDKLMHFADDIIAIEQSTYEPGRRDNPASLATWLKHEGSLALGLVGKIDGKDRLLGYCIGGPLEQARADGVKDDPFYGKNCTFYSANVSLDERLRGKGLGRFLKNEQIKRVSAMKDADLKSRYRFMAGRNRLGHADIMTQINELSGAYSVRIYDNQYGELGAKASYYRLPLTKAHRPLPTLPDKNLLDCQNSIQSPFKNIPESLAKAFSHNYFRVYAASKITLSNWATSNLVRYAELLRAVLPSGFNHAYFTSGRDEMVDKGLRSMRYHRKDADIVLGFSHQWFGSVTAASRSLSHAEGQAEPFHYFNWPQIPHPALVGNEKSLALLRAALDEIPADKILGIVLELMGERSGFGFDEHFLQELDLIRAKTSIPLIFSETTSGLGRSGRGLFLSEALSVKANALWAYMGGQLGHVFVDDAYFVDKPLTLISTWDGDEISIIRAYHHILAAKNSVLSQNARVFEEKIKKLGSKENHCGQGIWHAFTFKNHELRDKAVSLAKEHGVIFGHGFNNALMICPRADFSEKEFNHVLDSLSLCLKLNH